MVINLIYDRKDERLLRREPSFLAGPRGQDQDSSLRELGSSLRSLFAPMIAEK